MIHTWFVSTTKRMDGAGGGVEWCLDVCETEDEAKALAAEAIVRGLRVEAGTAPGVEPRVRIGWRTSREWARQPDDRGIMSLRRRLADFAA
jgi:hypothetical protein